MASDDQKPSAFSDLWTLIKGRDRRPEVNFVLAGFGEVGKTTVLYQLAGKLEEVTPTVAFNVEIVYHRSTKITIWDAAGDPRSHEFAFHSVLKNLEVAALIYVIDSTNRDQLDQSSEALHTYLNLLNMKFAPLLVLANKIDLGDHLGELEISEGLGLSQSSGRQWHIQFCCAKSGQGLEQGLDWVIDALQKANADQEIPESRGLITDYTAHNSNAFSVFSCCF